MNLVKPGNSMVGEELLQVRVETAALKEPIPQKYHTIVLIFAEQAFVHQGLSIPNRICDRYPLRPRDQMPIVLHAGGDYIVLECAFEIFYDQEVLRPDLNRPDDRARSQCDV